MVPADSPRIPRVPGYSGAASPRLRISLTGLSPSAAPLSSGFCYAPSSASPAVLQPRAARRHAPGLGWCGFARRYFRNHWFVFSSSGYLDVSVPRVRPWLGQVPGSRPAGCPIRKSAHQRVFAPTRGLSQLVTSFVASESLGILHAPFSPFLFSFICSRRTRPRLVRPRLNPGGTPGRGRLVNSSFIALYTLSKSIIAARRSGLARSCLLP